MGAQENRGGGGAGRITQKKSYTFHNRKGLKGGRQEKKGKIRGCKERGAGGMDPLSPHHFSDLDVLFVCVIFWDKYRNLTYVTLTRFL